MTFDEFLSADLLPVDCNDERVHAWMRLCWSVAYAQGYEKRMMEDRNVTR